MNQALWLKKRNELKAVASESVVPPTRYILVSCRPLEDSENKVLSKNFKNIIVYNAALNSGNLDLSKMTFDLLVIDVSKKENHLFLEIVSPMAAGLNVPIIVLKKKMSNYDQLVEALEAYVVSKIEDLEGQNFFNFLVKNKLPKLDNKCSNLFKRCLSAVLKA
jgi:hypothetical protein